MLVMELRGALMALLVGALAYGGSHLWWRAAEQARTNAVLLLQEAQHRRHESLEAQRTLDGYQRRYTQLHDHGIVGSGSRLAWAEAVQTTARGLGVAVRYQLAPAQTLTTDEGLAIEIHPMQVALDLRHEGELLRLMEAAARAAPGVLWVRHCALTPVSAAGGLRAQCRFDWVTVKMQSQGDEA